MTRSFSRLPAGTKRIKTILISSLAVSTRADLEAWQMHLEEMGVEKAPTADRPCTQSPITDRPYGSVLVFRDPDNLQLEMFAPLTS